MTSLQTHLRKRAPAVPQAGKVQRQKVPAELPPVVPQVCKHRKNYQIILVENLASKIPRQVFNIMAGGLPHATRTEKIQ